MLVTNKLSGEILWETGIMKFEQSERITNGIYIQHTLQLYLVQLLKYKTN